MRKCELKKCGRKYFAKGYCQYHYQVYKSGPKRKEKEHYLYRTWVGMKQRCYDKNHSVYSYYGGRGIYICDRWLESFDNFLEDMGDRPSPKHSIDRRDNDGPYAPWNCRWATKKQQQNNRRLNKKKKRPKLDKNKLERLSQGK